MSTTSSPIISGGSPPVEPVKASPVNPTTPTASKTTIVQLGAATLGAAGNLQPGTGTIEVPGSYFYVRATSAAIQIRVPGGTWSSYLTGDHLRVLPQNAWPRLEVQNLGATAISAAIFVGFDTFGTDRVILQAPLNPQVQFPCFNDSGGAYADIPDRTGTLQNDLNGMQWLLVYRIGILISMTSASGQPLVFVKLGTRSFVKGTTPAIAYSNAQSNLFLPIVGGCTALANGGGGVTGIISETYSVLPTTLLT